MQINTPLAFAGIWRKPLHQLDVMTEGFEQSVLVADPSKSEGIILTEEDCTPAEIERAVHSILPTDQLVIRHTIQVPGPNGGMVSYASTTSSDRASEDLPALMAHAGQVVRECIQARKGGFRALSALMNHKFVNGADLEENLKPPDRKTFH